MGSIHTLLYENTALAALIAAGIAVGVAAALSALRQLLLRRLKPTTAIRSFALVMARHTRFSFLVLLSIGIGSSYLVLPVSLRHLLRVIVALATLAQIGWWGQGITKFWVQRVIKRRMKSDVGSVTLIRTLGTIVLVTLWALILVTVVGILGVNVTALLAGVSIGGIAIALAVQNVASDLLASVSIIVDKPFVVGDFIAVGTEMGTVQQIGLKTTRIGSLSGEQIILGNSDLLKSRIHNYKRMAERRVVFTLGVEYGTKQALVEKIPEMIRSAITAQSPVRLDRAHFKEFGDSALTYEAVYYVLSPDYNKYMDIQQAINFTLYNEFTEQGIGFAFPTRTVLLELPQDTTDALGALISRHDLPAPKPAS